MLGFSFLLKLILCWTSTFQQKQQGSEGGVNTWLWVWLHMIVYRHRLYVGPAVQHKVFSRQINSNQQNLLVWQPVFHSVNLAMGYVLLNTFIRTNLFNAAINHQHIVSRQTFSEVVSVFIQNEPTCSNHDVFRLPALTLKLFQALFGLQRHLTNCCAVSLCSPAANPEFSCERR